MTREAVAACCPAPPRPRDVILTSPPNWTAVLFFAVLGALHFSVALPAFYRGRWEGYLSLIFGCVFALVTVVSYFARYEVAILARERCIRLRRGLGALNVHRDIPFDDVHAVRVTFSSSSRNGRAGESVIEVLCDNEDLECPPTTIPRQEALYLAVTMGVQLIKVTHETAAPDRGPRQV